MLPGHPVHWPVDVSQGVLWGDDVQLFVLRNNDFLFLFFRLLLRFLLRLLFLFGLRAWLVVLVVFVLVVCTLCRGLIFVFLPLFVVIVVFHYLLVASDASALLDKLVLD